MEEVPILMWIFYALGIYVPRAYFSGLEVMIMADLFQKAQENLSFLLVCAVIVVALLLVSRISEHYLPSLHRPSQARRITIVAICSALAAILHMLDFPLLFLAPGFYKLDFSELPVILCGFYLGPTAAVICEILKILLKLLINSTSTMFVGDLANFLVGCSFVLPAIIIYHLKKTRNIALIGLCVGTLVLTVFGSLFNAWYLLPTFAKMYFGADLSKIIAEGAKINPAISNITEFVLLAVVPLNLIKGCSVSALTLLLYKRIARPLFGK